MWTASSGAQPRSTISSSASVLRTGEALLLDETPIAGWRNLGLGEATLSWILRDPRRDV